MADGFSPLPVQLVYWSVHPPFYRHASGGGRTFDLIATGCATAAASETLALMGSTGLRKWMCSSIPWAPMNREDV